MRSRTMSQINKNTLISWVNKAIVSVCLILGSMFTSYNLIAFKTDKAAFYYNDDNQFWLAFGISILALSWIVRNWKKI